MQSNTALDQPDQQDHRFSYTSYARAGVNRIVKWPVQPVQPVQALTLPNPDLGRG